MSAREIPGAGAANKAEPPPEINTITRSFSCKFDKLRDYLFSRIEALLVGDGMASLKNCKFIFEG